VIIALDEGGWVGITLAYDRHDACNAGHSAARMIEKGQIALLHLVAQVVAGLEIPHAVPSGGLVSGLGEIVDAEGGGL
jgi:hypothetical protein